MQTITKIGKVESESKTERGRYKNTKHGWSAIYYG